MLPGLQFTTTMSCKHTLKATHIRQQEQNLGALINKRQVTYNMVVESVAFWSKQRACNHIYN